MMPENVPNLGKEANIQVQEAWRVPNKVNPKRSTPKHTIIKMSKIKDKERLLKAARETNCYIKGNPYKVTNIFLSRNFALPEGIGMTYSKC